jgi:hypothetical protein
VQVPGPPYAPPQPGKAEAACRGLRQADLRPDSEAGGAGAAAVDAIDQRRRAGHRTGAGLADRQGVSRLSECCGDAFDAQCRQGAAASAAASRPAPSGKDQPARRGRGASAMGGNSSSSGVRVASSASRDFGGAGSMRSLSPSLR